MQMIWNLIYSNLLIMVDKIMNNDFKVLMFVHLFILRRCLYFQNVKIYSCDIMSYFFLDHMLSFSKQNHIIFIIRL